MKYPNYTVGERQSVRAAILSATASRKGWFDPPEIADEIQPKIRALHAPLWEAIQIELEYLTRQGFFEKTTYQSMGPGYSEWESHSHGTVMYKRRNQGRVKDLEAEEKYHELRRKAGFEAY
jgi:hypothetical protein